jgi:hypothetical protein
MKPTVLVLAVSMNQYDLLMQLRKVSDLDLSWQQPIGCQQKAYYKYIF